MLEGLAEDERTQNMCVRMIEENGQGEETPTPIRDKEKVDIFFEGVLVLSHRGKIPYCMQDSPSRGIMEGRNNIFGHFSHFG